MKLGNSTFKLRLRISSTPGEPTVWKLRPQNGVDLYVGEPLGELEAASSATAGHE